VTFERGVVCGGGFRDSPAHQLTSPVTSSAAEEVSWRTAGAWLLEDDTRVTGPLTAPLCQSLTHTTLALTRTHAHTHTHINHTHTHINHTHTHINHTHINTSRRSLAPRSAATRAGRSTPPSRSWGMRAPTGRQSTPFMISGTASSPGASSHTQVSLTPGRLGWFTIITYVMSHLQAYLNTEWFGWWLELQKRCGLLRACAAQY
jgi:hypothetical protein